MNVIKNDTYDYRDGYREAQCQGNIRRLLRRIGRRDMVVGSIKFRVGCGPDSSSWKVGWMSRCACSVTRRLTYLREHSMNRKSLVWQETGIVSGRTHLGIAFDFELF